jgi:hypothetical protein
VTWRSPGYLGCSPSWSSDSRFGNGDCYITARSSGMYFTHGTLWIILIHALQMATLQYTIANQTTAKPSANGLPAPPARQPIPLLRWPSGVSLLRAPVPPLTRASTAPSPTAPSLRQRSRSVSRPIAGKTLKKTTMWSGRRPSRLDRTWRVLPTRVNTS